MRGMQGRPRFGVEFISARMHASFNSLGSVGHGTMPPSCFKPPLGVVGRLHAEPGLGSMNSRGGDITPCFARAMSIAISSAPPSTGVDVGGSTRSGDSGTQKLEQAGMLSYYQYVFETRGASVVSPFGKRDGRWRAARLLCRLSRLLECSR